MVFRLRGNPSAVGLVVDVAGKRRVFMPLTRVTSIANGQVITTGLLNIRRFEKRPSGPMCWARSSIARLSSTMVREKAINGGRAYRTDGSPRMKLTSLYVRVMAWWAGGGKYEDHCLGHSGLRTRVASQAATALLAQIN